MWSMMWSNKTHISYNRVLCILNNRRWDILLIHPGCWCGPDCGLLYCDLPRQLILCWTVLNYLVWILLVTISVLWCSRLFIVFICRLVLYFRFLFILSLTIVVCHFYFFCMCILLLILIICLLLFHRGFHFAFLNCPLLLLGTRLLVISLWISLSWAHEITVCDLWICTWLSFGILLWLRLITILLRNLLLFLFLLECPKSDNINSIP